MALYCSLRSIHEGIFRCVRQFCLCVSFSFSVVWQRVFLFLRHILCTFKSFDIIDVERFTRFIFKHLVFIFSWIFPLFKHYSVNSQKLLQKSKFVDGLSKSLHFYCTDIQNCDLFYRNPKCLLSFYVLLIGLKYSFPFPFDDKCNEHLSRDIHLKRICLSFDFELLFE